MKLNRQETATALAALRYWQKKVIVEREIDPDFGDEELSIDDIPEDLRDHFEGENVEPLNAAEIDALCESINFDGEEPPTFLMTAINDGNDQQELEATEYDAAVVEALEIAGYAVLSREEYKEHLGE